MTNRMVSLRSKLLIASTLAALLTGTGMAVAQVSDNPPGSEFQDQGIREDNGLPRFGEEHYGVRGAYGAEQHRAYGARSNASHRSDVARHQRDRSDLND